MHGNSLRRAFAAVAAVAALTGVAACGSGGGSGDGGGLFNGGKKSESPQKSESGDSTVAMSLTALQRVEEKTDQANSAKVTGSMDVGESKMTMDGEIDWRDGLLGNLAMEQTGGVLDQAGGDGKMLARYTKDVMYVNMGPSFSVQTGGKNWISYDYDDLADLAGPSGAVLKDQIQNNTPTQSVKLLLASPDVKKVGTERVGDEDTTHYSGTIDVADFTEKSSKTLTQEELDTFKKQLEQNGTTTERIDVWVNSDDLLVKKVESADTAQGAMEFTAYYSDYGVDVEVETPAPSDTVDFTTLMNQGT